ncbi:hypothetical protein [Nocardia wallacei]|uniref:hypothetical protein n=1 Tax=Nocardia wallacei TaxID=480035 RepID=UPI00245865AF|nr:hypothetical protein [Nocardia wallacei]
MVAWATATAVRGRPRRQARPDPSPEPAPTSEFSLSQLDSRVEWADPTQIWPVLEVENALLAARLAGRMTPVDYRTRIFVLALHCEPHAASDGA